MAKLDKKQEELIAEALNTEEGKEMFRKGVSEACMNGFRIFAETIFSKWDKKHQERWMDTAFGITWRERLLNI